MYKPITTEFRTAFTRVFSFFTRHVRRRPWGRGCSEESQQNADFENLHLMGVLFKQVQYWLTKEIYRYPIKNQNMFTVYRNVCLHISI